MTYHHSHICQTEAVSFNSSVKRHTVTISQFTKEIITRQYLMTHQYHHQAISYDSPRGGILHCHNISQYLTISFNILYHQAISYDSPRGGVSQITEKGETTASFLLIQVISKKSRRWLAKSYSQYHCNHNITSVFNSIATITSVHNNYNHIQCVQWLQS